MVIRGCRGLAFVKQRFGAALKEWEKKPKSVAWPKCLRGTPHGGGLVHVLMLAPRAKGVVKVNV